jgi:hypothetical protein
LVHGIALTARRVQSAHERETLVPLLRNWLAALAAGVAAAGTAANPIARQMITVLATLAGGDPSVSTLAPDARAKAELKLIAAAAGIANSPILGVRLDYSQMKPRGHYADDPLLAAYFTASRYAGTAPFLLNPSPATGVDADRADRLVAAAQALSALMNSGVAAPLTTQLFAALAAAFGTVEDYGAPDFAGVSGTPAAVRAALVAAAPTRGRLPSVVDVPIDVRRLGKLSSAEAAISWRILPGRRLADVAAMQALTYPATGALNDPLAKPFGAVRIDGVTVKGAVGFDDLFAVYGADASRWNVEGQFDGLVKATPVARVALARAAGPDAALGQFLRQALGPTTAVPARRLLPLAGHYVHYRHGLALYAKQSMSAAPKGLVLSRARDPGLLEADGTMIAALRGLVRAHAERLPSPMWRDWDSLLTRLEAISWRANFACPAGEDGDWLNDLDLSVAALVDVAHDVPIVADIHTIPAEQAVVEIGIGHAVAVSFGKARGADFSLYQFRQPIAERLTDAEFAVRLGGAMSVPAWPISGAPR